MLQICHRTQEVVTVFETHKNVLAMPHGLSKTPQSAEYSG